MIQVSNYCEQSIGLPAHNTHQGRLLQWADDATFLRETSKIGIVVGLVSTVAGVVFNFDPTAALAWTTACAIAWVSFDACARQLEPQACNILKHLKDVKDGKA